MTNVTTAARFPLKGSRRQNNRLNQAA